MIWLAALAIWICLAVISLATDSIVMYLTFTGRLGGDFLAKTLVTAARSGGVHRWVLKSLLIDIAEPWLIWQGLLGGLFAD